MIQKVVSDSSSSWSPGPLQLDSLGPTGRSAHKECRLHTEGVLSRYEGCYLASVRACYVLHCPGDGLLLTVITRNMTRCHLFDQGDRAASEASSCHPAAVHSGHLATR